jgi:hypothetical protein
VQHARMYNVKRLHPNMLTCFVFHEEIWGNPSLGYNSFWIYTAARDSCLDFISNGNILYVCMYTVYTCHIFILKSCIQLYKKMETLLCELRIRFRNKFLQTNIFWKLETDRTDMLVEEKGDMSVTHECQHYEYTGLSCKKRNKMFIRVLYVFN